MAAALLLAVAIDRLLGEPPNRVHPVVWIGSLIGALTPKRRFSPGFELLYGGLLAMALPAAAFLLTAKVMALFAALPWLSFGVHVYLLKSTFSLDGLRRAGKRMHDALGAGVPQGRDALPWLCSRPADGLQEPELVAATVESVAENASDSFVAPVLFYVTFGLPGAMFYRVVNTMDAMIGYRGRYEYVGKAAARLDDLCNLLPARLCALLLLAAGTLRGEDARFGLSVMWRDRGRTQSPNAGWPMAAMAGLLSVVLEKPGHYRLGSGDVPRDRALIGRATAIVSLAGCLLLPLALSLIGVTRGF